jgi:hypothetical protein
MESTIWQSIGSQDFRLHIEKISSLIKKKLKAKW